MGDKPSAGSKESEIGKVYEHIPPRPPPDASEEREKRGIQHRAQWKAKPPWEKLKVELFFFALGSPIVAWLYPLDLENHRQQKLVVLLVLVLALIVYRLWQWWRWKPEGDA